MNEQVKKFLNTTLTEAEYYSLPKENLITLKEYLLQLKDKDNDFQTAIQEQFQSIKKKCSWLSAISFGGLIHESGNYEITAIYLYSKDGIDLIANCNHSSDRYEDLTKNYMPAKVLRVGCGTGSLEHWMSKNGHDVTGIEMNQEMLETANRRRRFPNMALRFFQMSSLEMVRFLGKGFYNVISCLNDDLIFRNDEILVKKFFFDCKTLLAENGVLVLQIENFEKYNLEEDFKLSIRESIRTKLHTKISYRDGKHFLSQTKTACHIFQIISRILVLLMLINLLK